MAEEQKIEEKVEEKPAEEVKEEPKAEKEEKKKVTEKKSEGKKPKAHVSEFKKENVKKITENLKNSKTVMIVSIKNLPSQQLQKIKKDLREKADIKVAKRSTLIKAIETTAIPEMQDLRKHVVGDTAVLFSNDDAFELAAWLTDNRNPIAAKAGQEATDDINVEPGPTDLIPGPDISALSAVGLEVAVEEGKLAIKKGATIVKSGEEVTDEVASVLQKLDIKPFMIGLNPAVIYDSVEKKIYVGVKIDKDEVLNNLLQGQAKAIGFAQGLNIITKETIVYFLSKAYAEANALEKLSPDEEVKEEPKEGEEAKEAPSEEEKVEEKPAEEVKEEPKAEEEKKEDTQEIKSEEAK